MRGSTTRKREAQKAISMLTTFELQTCCVHLSPAVRYPCHFLPAVLLSSPLVSGTNLKSTHYSQFAVLTTPFHIYALQLDVHRWLSECQNLLATPQCSECRYPYELDRVCARQLSLSLSLSLSLLVSSLYSHWNHTAKTNREDECLVCSALRATIEEVSLETSALSRQLAEARYQSKEREEQLEIYQSALDAAEKQV